MLKLLSPLAGQRYFITGTDTGIGKTKVTCALLQNLQQQGKSVIALKPILSGAPHEENSDTQLLMQQNSLKLSESFITPYQLPLPTSPHIVAAKNQINLQVNNVIQACQPALSQAVDAVFIEGAGGWRVPLNSHETMANLAAAFSCPIILVVGMRLGCLNHALLTAEAIHADGLPLAGWIANQIDPHFNFYNDYLETLTSRLPAPLLAQLPYQQ